MAKIANPKSPRIPKFGKHLGLQGGLRLKSWIT
jgi:hypothetical protein